MRWTAGAGLTSVAERVVRQIGWSWWAAGDRSSLEVFGPPALFCRLRAPKSRGGCGRWVGLDEAVRGERARIGAELQGVGM